MHKLVIKKGKLDSKKSGFYVESEFMIGDADGYETVKSGPFKDERACMDFLDMLDSIATREDNFKLEPGIYLDRGTPRCNIYWAANDMYKVPEKYLKIPKEKKDYINQDLIDKIDFNIPSEPYDGCLCVCQSYEVYYIDENNKKYEVEYKDDGKDNLRTELHPIEYTQDDFNSYEVVTWIERENRTSRWTGNKDKLESLKQGKMKILSGGKWEPETLIKYRVDDWQHLLKSNPWKGPDGNILENQEN